MANVLENCTLHQKLEWLRDVPDSELHYYLTPEELSQLKREKTDFSAFQNYEVIALDVIPPLEPDSYAAEAAWRELLGE